MAAHRCPRTVPYWARSRRAPCPGTVLIPENAGRENAHRQLSSPRSLPALRRGRGQPGRHAGGLGPLRRAARRRSSFQSVWASSTCPGSHSSALARRVPRRASCRRKPDAGPTREKSSLQSPEVRDAGGGHGRRGARLQQPSCDHQREPAHPAEAPSRDDRGEARSGHVARDPSGCAPHAAIAVVHAQAGAQAGDR